MSTSLKSSPNLIFYLPEREQRKTTSTEAL